MVGAHLGAFTITSHVFMFTNLSVLLTILGFHLPLPSLSALYATGFVEAVTGTPGVVLPTGYWYGVVYAEVVVIMCTTVCVFGAGAFGRASLLIFSVSMISLADVLVNFFIADPNAHIASPAVNPISFTNLSFTGFSSTTLESNLYPAMTHDYVSGSNSTASTVFGLLFNGCAFW